MRIHEDSQNNSVSTISTELSVIEEKQKNYFSANTEIKELPDKENKPKNEFKEPIWKCRYVPVLVLFIISIYGTHIRLNVSINLVAMVNYSAISYEEKMKSESCQHLVRNVTEDVPSYKAEGEFDWSPKLQGYILGSPFLGQIVAQLPIGLITERNGAKWVLFWSFLVSGVVAILIPFISYVTVYALVVLLVIRGLAQGSVMPAVAILGSNWFPKVERGFLFSLTKTGGPLGCFLGSIMSGYICESAGGWPASNYVTGGLGIIIAILIFVFLYENPKAHPRISKEELNFILNNQENALTRRRPKLPWRKILKSVPVYALAYALFGQGWALSQFWTVHSTFLATILHYPIGENGLLTALPFALQFFISQITSWISLYVQKKNVCGVDFLRKFWNSVACIGFSACLLGMYLSECNRTFSVIFAMLSIGFTGAANSGSWIVITDMTPTFAGTVLAYCLIIAFLSTFLAPVVIGYLINESQTIEQWNKVFFLCIGVVMSSAIIFAAFGSAEVQPWNFVEEGNIPKAKETNQVNEIDDKSENFKSEEKTRF